MMALAYPKSAAEAREEIACDHFMNALGDADFALKLKERAPMSLDEALRIALRLEAWEKSTKMSKFDEERIDRAKQKVRTAGKQPTSKVTEPDQDTRLKKVETEVTKMVADMNRRYDKLQKLIVERQQPLQTDRNCVE